MTDLIDPGIAEAQAAQAQAVQPFDLFSLPVAEVRRLANAAYGFWNRSKPPLEICEDLAIPGPGGPIALRRYGLENCGPEMAHDRLTVLYLHGGGWVFGNLDSHDRLCRLLARQAGAEVVAVDYRLAPEHPFPAGLDDALTAWRWLRSMRPSARLAVAGDSAGANLALALCLVLRDGGEPVPAAASLFYGCYLPRFDLDSHRLHGDGCFGLSTADMRWFWQQYLGKPPHPAPSLAAPATADLSGLPPLYLSAAALDPQLDDTRLLAERLAQAGIVHEVDLWPGAVHGFLQMTAHAPLAVAALDKASIALRRLATL
jgi:acetyl esterase